MNMRSKLTNAFMGLVLLTTANAHAGGRNEQNVTIDQSRTTNIDKQIIDKGPKYDNRSFDNSTTATGGNSSGQSNNQTVNGGHTNIDARGGAITGAPGIFFGTNPNLCGDVKFLSIGGGGPFVGSGGIGGGLNSSPGVPMPYTATEILKMKPEDRWDVFKKYGLSESEVERTQCVISFFETSEKAMTHEEAMTSKKLQHEMIMAILAHGLNRNSHAPGKQDGASSLEHAWVQVYARESSALYKIAGNKTIEAYIELKDNNKRTRPEDILRMVFENEKKTESKDKPSQPTPSTSFP